MSAVIGASQGNGCSEVKNRGQARRLVVLDTGTSTARLGACCETIDVSSRIACSRRRALRPGSQSCFSAGVILRFGETGPHAAPALSPMQRPLTTPTAPRARYGSIFSDVMYPLRIAVPASSTLPTPNSTLLLVWMIL